MPLFLLVVPQASSLQSLPKAAWSPLPLWVTAQQSSAGWGTTRALLPSYF